MSRCSDLTRREWLRLTAAGAVHAAALGTLAPGAAAARPLGVQLYTVRDRLGDDARATLEAIAKIGYRELELGRSDIARLTPIARELGLSPVATHIEAPLVTGNWEAWPWLKNMPAELRGEGGLRRALDEVRRHGLRYAIVAYLMPGERERTASYFERFADQLNRAGETAKAAGLTFAYHNHAFEFDPLPDGRVPLDILAERLDPALVKFELDVFWVAVTGADPVETIRRYGRHVELLHLKDKAASAPKAMQESDVPRTAFVPAGSGTVDFAAVVKAGDAVGVRHLFVEQDHTEGDPIASLRQSYAHLAQVL